MAEPFRGDLEAAHARIATLDEENLRLRAGLDDRSARRQRRALIAAGACFVAALLTATGSAVAMSMMRDDNAALRAELERERDRSRAAPPRTASDDARSARIAQIFSTRFERQPRPEELARWLGQDAAQDAQIGEVLARSPEGQERIHGLYQTYLDRRAEPEGLQHWTRLLAVSSLDAVRGGIAGSSEAAQKRELHKPPCDPPWDATGTRKQECPTK